MIRLIQAALFEKVPVSEKGQVNGVTPLNEYGKVDPQYLPGYVNSVVAIYLDPETGKAYYDRNHTREYTDFDRETIYNDLHGTGSYRWTGEHLCIIPDTSAMVEITAEEVKEMWGLIHESGLSPEELLKRLDEELSELGD